MPEGELLGSAAVCQAKDLNEDLPINWEGLGQSQKSDPSLHLGRMKTLCRLLNVVYWPEIQRDVWDHCKQCQVCQQYKPRISKLSGTLQSTPVKRTWIYGQ